MKLNCEFLLDRSFVQNFKNNEYFFEFFYISHNETTIKRTQANKKQNFLHFFIFFFPFQQSLIVFDVPKNFAKRFKFSKVYLKVQIFNLF